MENAAYDKDRLQLFNEALRALLSTLQPSPESDAARRRVVADMQALVAEALPAHLHCGVETFGSFRAGLHLPGSDLDFALTGWVAVGQDEDDAGGSSSSGGTQQQRELHTWSSLEQQYLLADLANALEAKGLVQGQVERILHARVPVIKCVHAATGVHCDFSISRPECAFKAEMQKLLGSLDRRYAALYRLVKCWAAAHGLNDAASNTLNSWSLGLMVAFYLQCEQPALLPPIWQLLEQQQPSMAAPRILQNPGITSAALQKTLNLATTGAGAFVGRRTRQGTDAVNPKTLAELLLGFFEFFGAQMRVWVTGRDIGYRASTWWGRWVNAAWGPSKKYTFSIEDPFHAADNTARSVGTTNHLTATSTATYISWAVTTSARLMTDALAAAERDHTAAEAAATLENRDASTTRRVDSGSGGSSIAGSSSGSNAGDALSKQQQQQHKNMDAETNSGAGEVLSAFCWLFGPTAVLQLQQLPPPLLLQLQQLIPAADLEQLRSKVTSLGDCLAALGNSSCLDPNSNSSVRDDAQKVEEIKASLALFKQLLQLLGAKELDVCLGDFQHKQRERDRLLLLEFQQRQRQQQQQRQRQQLQEEGALQQRFGELRVGSAPSALPNWQQQQGQQQWQQEGGRASTGVYMQHTRSEELPIGRSASSSSNSSSGGIHTGRIMPNPPMYRSKAPAAPGRSRAGEQHQQQQQQQQQQWRRGETLRSSSSGSSSRTDWGSGRVGVQQQQQQQAHHGGIPMSSSAPVHIAGGYMTSRGAAAAAAAFGNSSGSTGGGRRDLRRSSSTEQQRLLAAEQQLYQ